MKLDVSMKEKTEVNDRDAEMKVMSRVDCSDTEASAAFIDDERDIEKNAKE